MSKDNEQLIELIETGSEIAGAAVGGAVGFLVAGPVGAAAVGTGGVLITRAFNKIGIELKNRFLGKREEIRIGATISLAATKIKNRIDEGKKIREDDFFINKIKDRSDADEVY